MEERAFSNLPAQYHKHALLTKSAYLIVRDPKLSLMYR